MSDRPKEPEIIFPNILEMQDSSATIYCDGERNRFDEKEFYRLSDGTLIQPYIHRGTAYRPTHFADGGLPVEVNEDELASGKVTIHVKDTIPAILNMVPRRQRNWEILEEPIKPLPTSHGTDLDTALHYDQLDWPPPITIDNTGSTDPLNDEKKALYQAQLQLFTARQQGIIDRDKAVRASDYPFHQAVFQAYLDTAKGQIDRSVMRTQFLATAASAIGTIYTAVIGLSFGLGQPGHTLPAIGIAPAVFLGLSIVLAAFYLSYITTQSHVPSKPGVGEPEHVASILPAQRLIDERNNFMQQATDIVLRRLDFLHAAVISLAIGVLFLPVPFIVVPDWLVWLGVVLGILVVFIPIARSHVK